MLSDQWPTTCSGVDFPALIENLKATGHKLTLLTDGVSSDRLKANPNGKWSVHQHVGHLLTIESLWIARLDDFVMKHDQLRLADPFNEATETGGFNEQSLVGLITDFQAIRLAHLSMLSTLENQCEGMVVLDSVANRSVRLIDHVKSMLEHDFIHLTAIELLLGAHA